MAGITGNEAEPKGGTIASVIFDRIRTDILPGRFKPEEKLRIETLREIYQAGGTPIREALNRLTAEGLVKQQDQRGFQVAPMSLEDLNDLTRARCLLYEVAFRESIARGDLAWEEGVLIAYHRLSRASDIRGGGGPGPHPDWMKAHRAFHRALIAACGSNWLLEIIDTLFDRADRYRLFSGYAEEGQPLRDFRAEHEALKDAVLARDTERAIALIQDHVTHTANLAELHAHRLESSGKGRKRGSAG